MQVEERLNAFVKKLDDFLVSCSEFEESGAWDVDELGFMSAYFEADLTGVVMQIMSADHLFEGAEAEVFNRMFLTDYTSRTLRETYQLLKPVVDDYLDADAQDALETLGAIDPALADTYRELILDACEIVSLSDGVAEGEETELIEQLKEVLMA